jgi:hypothetical protein
MTAIKPILAACRSGYRSCGLPVAWPVIRLLDNHQFMADLTKLPRKYAKNIYLGVCYGEGGAKLARDCGLPTRWACALGGWKNRELLRNYKSACRLQIGRLCGDFRGCRSALSVSGDTCGLSGRF